MPFTYECAGCGVPVIKEVGTLKRAFCTRECYHRSTVKYPDRECPQCGKTFSSRKGSRSGPRTGKPGRTFCTWECYLASKENTVTKTCVGCGKEFTITRGSTAYRYNFCSRACKTADTIYVDCGRCGKRFANTDPKRLNRHYCSEECRRPPMYLTCRNCGKEFREIPSAAHRQFCSLACYRKFEGETRLETAVRLALESLGVEFAQEYGIGRWSIDFALVAHKIAIEADGTYWHSITAERDARRDAEIERAGWRVVRLPEQDVTDARDVARLVCDRVRDVTGLDLADFASPEGGAARPVIDGRKRPALRLRGRGPVIDGQLGLWDDDGSAA